MTITLRPHQVAAVDAIFDYFGRAAGNPLCVIPCGGGKSLTMAAFCRRAIEEHPETRILIATHRAELIQQDAAALAMLWPEADVGIYSAGLGQRRIRQVTVAGVQSIANVEGLPAFSLLLVDEAHLIPKEGDGQYRTLIKRLTELNPQLKVVGFTGTAFRYSGGSLTRGEGKIFSSICYSLPIETLVEGGYLVPLVTPSAGIGAKALSTTGVGTLAGDYKKGELASKVEGQESVTAAALADALRLAHDRHSWLVFCVSVEHARQAAAHLFSLGVSAYVVTGEDDMADRRRKIDAFKRGETRALVSVDVLNTGFDAPIADCIVMLRPTKSTGLYIQTAGRAMRTHPGKVDALFLDYAGVIEAHGPIAAVKPKEARATLPVNIKLCPRCDAENKSWVRACTECGFFFPLVPREIDHDKQASNNAIMGPPPPPEWIDIQGVDYERWEKRPTETNPNPVPTVVVKYLTGALAKKDYREWLCPAHGGFAAQKFRKTWHTRGGLSPAPTTVEDLLARKDELRPIEAIVVVKDGQYDRVTQVRFGEAKAVLPASFDFEDVEAPEQPTLDDYGEHEAMVDELWGEATTFDPHSSGFTDDDLPF